MSIKTDTLKKLTENLKKNKASGDILIGFDGFVDDIIAVIDKRKNVTTYSRI